MIEDVQNFQETIQNSFKAVKDIDLLKATVTLYVVKRKLRNRSATYTPRIVNIDNNLKYKLRNISSKKIEVSNQALEYDFNTSDLDNNVLGIETNETDLQNILDTINAPEPIQIVDKYEDLLGAWIYIARLDVPNNKPLYAIRRVSEGWSTKKVTQLSVNMIFSNNMLVDLDRQNIFRIDNKIDFFSYDGFIFIADKKNFEAALNFREGMEKNRDIIVEEFKEAKLFVNADEIKKFVGDSIPRLRKLSQVKNAGYYKDNSFLTSLKQVALEENWDIEYDNEGKMTVTEDNIDSILSVLNNGRLTSKVTKEIFDVDVKHKFEPK
ncbi:Kiwa anti-phage protein KwaB-like domain-containing protein [Plebeiibacterium sediminum]|uniref:DUF4868 domain-containing protein n=1 Tax=Plebeiibacterium sediminum TaxID=2992112 RepID=A0AAE3M5H4_9BACT|nr:Kiwa anti-phage protein KwaB-like domain-containing protein [Plebeiobacterium sediminum]MCW3787227.1 DUF4868 domain-containing protein [Plebeiobacterium sediminum]